MDSRQQQPTWIQHPDRDRINAQIAVRDSQNVADWIETRDWGGSTSTLRSPYDSDTAKFWQSSIYFMIRDTLWKAAMDYRLEVVQTARLFAMGFTAAADGAIGCVDAKYHYMAWRPRYAIWRADTDGTR